MSVAFYGTQEVVLSFEAGTVTAGHPVVVSENNKVSNAGDGDLFAGIALDVRRDIAAVQMKGYLEMPYTGAAPSLGWSAVVADGQGGVKADSDGILCLVVNVDTAGQTVGLYL